MVEGKSNEKLQNEYVYSSVYLSADFALLISRLNMTTTTDVLLNNAQKSLLVRTFIDFFKINIENFL
jgi:hypothetical protein